MADYLQVLVRTGGDIEESELLTGVDADTLSQWREEDPMFASIEAQTLMWTVRMKAGRRSAARKHGRLVTKPTLSWQKRRSRLLGREDEFRLLWADPHTRRTDIAKRFNVASGTVYNWAQILGLENPHRTAKGKM